jgi:hypothetical protein
MSKDKIWNAFCLKNKVLGKSVPLFEESSGLVHTFQYGNNRRTLLKRSESMETLVSNEVKKLTDDFEAGTNLYEGIIYMMFWKDGESIVPLYIGKSEKLGLNKNDLSTNLTDPRGKFARWGYNYAYHVGDLSAVVCEGHSPDKGTPKYHQWAEKLFTSYPSSAPTLNQGVWFWAKAWETGSTGIWEDFGPTSLTFLEYLLIGVASDLFPEVLLNREGVNRS